MLLWAISVRRRRLVRNGSFSDRLVLYLLDESCVDIVIPRKYKFLLKPSIVELTSVIQVSYL